MFLMPVGTSDNTMRAYASFLIGARPASISRSICDSRDIVPRRCYYVYLVLLGLDFGSFDAVQRFYLDGGCCFFASFDFAIRLFLGKTLCLEHLVFTNHRCVLRLADEVLVTLFSVNSCWHFYPLACCCWCCW